MTRMLPILLTMLGRCSRAGFSDCCLCTWRRAWWWIEWADRLPVWSCCPTWPSGGRCRHWSRWVGTACSPLFPRRPQQLHHYTPSTAPPPPTHTHTCARARKFTCRVFRVLLFKNRRLKVAETRHMSGAHFVPAVCIGDVMKMCMSRKKICMIRYNPFLLFTGEERTNMTAARFGAQFEAKNSVSCTCIDRTTPTKEKRKKKEASKQPSNQTTTTTTYGNIWACFLCFQPNFASAAWVRFPLTDWCVTLVLVCFMCDRTHSLLNWLMCYIGTGLFHVWPDSYLTVWCVTLIRVCLFHVWPDS